MSDDQASGLRARDERGAAVASPRTVGVVSGKGGVGKSVIAVNVALHAAACGARITLVDADAGLANADLLMGVVPRFDLDDWSRGHAPLEAVRCPGAFGLELLVAGRTVEAHRRLLRGLRGERNDPLADYLASRDLVVVDLGAGVAEPLIELATHCDRVLLVATPEPTSLADAYAVVKRTLRSRDALPIELVVNRASDRRAGERTHQALERLTRRFLECNLPLRSILVEDGRLLRSVSRQQPVVMAAPASRIARSLAGLAEQLLDQSAAGARDRAGPASRRVGTAQAPAGLPG